MAMNHCGVLRKITGFLERQECGYWCFSRPRAISAWPRQRLDDGLVGVALVALVVDDALALEARRILGEAAIAVDGEGDGRCRCRAFRSSRRLRHPDVEVLAAVARRGVHEARAVLVRDVVAFQQRNRESDSRRSCKRMLRRQ